MKWYFVFQLIPLDTKFDFNFLPRQFSFVQLSHLWIWKNLFPAFYYDEYVSSNHELPYLKTIESEVTIERFNLSYEKSNSVWNQDVLQNLKCQSSKIMSCNLKLVTFDVHKDVYNMHLPSIIDSS